MSRSINRLTLVGNVGQDPELRSTQSGQRVATFSLATSQAWKDASGERQEKVQWHRCVAWNGRSDRGPQLADVVDRYVTKGDKVYLEGRVEYRQYEDREGQTRHTTEVIVSHLLLLGSPRHQDDVNDRATRTATPERSEKGSARAGTMPAAGKKADLFEAGADWEDFPGAKDEDDELPF